MVKDLENLQTRSSGFRSGGDFRHLGLLLGIVLLGAGLRLYHLGTYGLWRDEAETVFIASAGFPVEISRILSSSAHAPLYFYLLHFWLGLAGYSEFGVRLLSALCGIVSVPLIYVAGRELFDRKVGLLAAWIGAVLPLHVACSRTTRMYTLLPMLGLLALIFLYRALEKGEKRAWLAYALLAAATMYTHYWGILWVGALSGYALFQLLWERRPKSGYGAWILAEIGIAVLFSPYLPILWGQLQVQESAVGPWLPQQSIIATVLRLFNELTALAWPRGYPYLWVILLALGAFAIRLQRAENVLSLDIAYPITPARNLVVAGLALPMILGPLLARSQGLLPSYAAMVVFPVLCLLLALGVIALHHWLFVLAVLTGISFLWLRADSRLYQGPISVLREIAQHVGKNAGEQDVIIVAPDYLAPTFSYYFRGPQPQAAFPWLPQRVEMVDWAGWAERRRRAAEAIPAMLDYIARARGPSGKIWLIAPLEAYPKDTFFDQIRALKTALDAKYRLLEVILDYRGPVETADILVYGSD